MPELAVPAPLSISGNLAIDNVLRHGTRRLRHVIAALVRVVLGIDRGAYDSWFSVFPRSHHFLARLIVNLDFVDVKIVPR